MDLTGMQRTWPVSLQRTPHHTPRLACISAPSLLAAQEQAHKEWDRHFASIQVHEPVHGPTPARDSRTPGNRTSNP